MLLKMTETVIQRFLDLGCFSHPPPPGRPHCISSDINLYSFLFLSTFQNLCISRVRYISSRFTYQIMVRYSKLRVTYAEHAFFKGLFQRTPTTLLSIKLHNC